jgi:hypothetical protein
MLIYDIYADCRAWPPRCTTAAVGPKSAPRWGVFRGVRWVCGGIYVIVIHRGYTAGGVILEKNGLAVDI